MQGYYVHGIGTALPGRCLDQEDSAGLLRQACRSERTAKLMRRVLRLTGVQRRYLVALDHQQGESADSLYRPAADQPDGPGMMARSARFNQDAEPLIAGALQAFAYEQLRSVEALVTVSCTHASSPGLEQAIFAQSSVPTSVDRWNLGFMGCSASLAALRLVHQTRASARPTLVVSCELSSLHFQYTDAIDQLTANLLFADGAAAMLLSPQESAIRLVDGRCATLPRAADQMVWIAGDHGLQLTLSQDLPVTLADALPNIVDEFLEANRLNRSSVDHWLVHPGGPQILDAVESCLGLPDDALAISRGILRNYGNMSSPTILFIMKELFATRGHGTCVALAFGPGLTIEMVLLQVEPDKSR